MMFFASVCIPLFVLAVFAVRRISHGSEGGFTADLRVLARGSFLPGLASGIPVLVLLLLAQRLIPVSYRPWRLFLYYFLRDQFLPALLLLLLASWLRQEGSFLRLTFFLAGAYTLLNWGQLSVGVGAQRPDLYRLCLLALIRMGMLIYLTVLFRRFLEEDGFLKVLYMGLMLLAAVTGGLVAYLYMRFYLWLALLVGIALPASTVTLLVSRRRI